MMRLHCDRCDALCDEYPTWVEDNGLAGVAAIWHLVIHAGGLIPCQEKMFCRVCRIAILETHVAALKKCDGNHGGPRCVDPECWNQ